jgi:CRISPR-associated protein Csy2
MIGEIKKLLIIPHINIHNANALSSPYTIGFPAMTAWLGATHALQRKLNAKNIPVKFLAIGVVSHDMDLQTYKGHNDFVHSIIGTGNPLVPKKKKEKGEPWSSFERPSFVEEARCHLDVSLVLEFDQLDVDEQAKMVETIKHLLQASMKIAGGDIKGFKSPYCIMSKEGDEQDLIKVRRALMPGYVLVERRDLMLEAMGHGQDALDSLIDYLAVHHSCDTDDEGNVTWRSQRKSINNKPAGWVVPIATGFHGISDLGEAKNQRDENTPHRFAESIVTLGEFKMPHRINFIDDMLWHYHVDGDLYICQQNAQRSSHGNSQSILQSNKKTDSIEDEF